MNLYYSALMILEFVISFYGGLHFLPECSILAYADAMKSVTDSLLIVCSLPFGLEMSLMLRNVISMFVN